MASEEPHRDEADSFTFSISGNLSFQKRVALPFAREVTEALLDDQWEEEDVPARAPDPQMTFGLGELIVLILILKDPVIDWVADGALDRAWATIRRGFRRGAARQGEVGGDPFKIKIEFRYTDTGVTSVVEVDVANEGDFDKAEALIEKAQRQALKVMREMNIRDAVLESRVEAGELRLAPELTQDLASKGKKTARRGRKPKDAS
jgi:hypothetical protein